jgi:hypothetical protein
MSIYLVTWDLNKEKPNYATARTKFLTKIDEYENIKDSSLDSVRFINTSWSASQISSDLREALDNNDSLFISKLVSGDYSGWLSQSVWDWINARL